jgi:hypothetical protein
VNARLLVISFTHSPTGHGTMQPPSAQPESSESPPLPCTGCEELYKALTSGPCGSKIEKAYRCYTKNPVRQKATKYFFLDIYIPLNNKYSRSKTIYGRSFANVVYLLSFFRLLKCFYSHNTHCNTISSLVTLFRQSSYSQEKRSCKVSNVGAHY